MTDELEDTSVLRARVMEETDPEAVLRAELKGMLGVEATGQSGGVDLAEAHEAARLAIVEAGWQHCERGLTRDDGLDADDIRDIAGLATGAAWEVFTARHAAEVESIQAAERERIALLLETAEPDACPWASNGPAIWQDAAGIARGPAGARARVDAPVEAQAYIEALKVERDQARTALAAAGQRGREQAAQAVAAWAATAQIGLARGCLCYGDECSGRCGYGKPLSWTLDPAEAVAVARGATPTPAGGEADGRTDPNPVIELFPADGLWLWECSVAGRRCYTGSTFHHAGSAADAAAPAPPAEGPAPAEGGAE